MKKILLATSALVTAGVIASPVLAQQESQEGSAMMAMSDESSITIFQEFGYASVSDNQTADRDSMYHDGEIAFNFASTSDAGLRYSANVELEVNGTQAANGIDEASMSLSTAEFGTVTLGSNDDVSSTFATYLPGGRNMASGDDWIATIVNGGGSSIAGASATGLSSSATGANYGDSNKVAYRSPNFGGFTFGGSYSLLSPAESQESGDTGDSANTSFGARYSMDLMGADVKLQYATVSNGEGGDEETSNTQYGINVGLDKFSVAASTNKSQTAATATVAKNDFTTSAIGAGYAVSDAIKVAVNVVTSENDTTDDSLDTTVLSLSYTIAPGLNFAVAMNQYDYDDATDNDNDLESDEVRASIQVNF